MALMNRQLDSGIFPILRVPLSITRYILSKEWKGKVERQNLRKRLIRNRWNFDQQFVWTCSKIFFLSLLSVHCLLLSLDGHNINGLLRSQVSGFRTFAFHQLLPKTKLPTPLSLHFIKGDCEKNLWPTTFRKKSQFFFNLLKRLLYRRDSQLINVLYLLLISSANLTQKKNYAKIRKNRTEFGLNSVSLMSVSFILFLISHPTNKLGTNAANKYLLFNIFWSILVLELTLFFSKTRVHSHWKIESFNWYGLIKNAPSVSFYFYLYSKGAERKRT